MGETLKADTTGISDPDGLTNPAYSYQWIRMDANTESEIEHAIGSSYKLGTGDISNSIKVRASFADDADHQETLSQPVGPVDFKIQPAGKC